MPSSQTPVRAKRLGLYGPFVAVAIGLAILSGYWVWLRAQALDRLEAYAASEAAAGGALRWSGLRVHGYPFRLDLDFTDVSWRGPDGHGASAPQLLAETLVFAPGHWVAMAPQGASILKPGGADTVSARVLRASLSDAQASPPTFSLEGLGLSWSTAQGAPPALFNTAAELHVHTRAGPGGQGAAYVEIDGAEPNPAGPLGRSPAPIGFVVDAIYSHAGALAGRDWAEALGAWSQRGGSLDVRSLRLTLGRASLRAAGQGLTVGPDGRLTGTLRGEAVDAVPMIAAMVADRLAGSSAAHMAEAAISSGGAPAPVTLTFSGGRTRLGPVDLAPAPKLY